MKIWQGDTQLKFRLSHFPDSQPHFKLLDEPDLDKSVTIEARLKTVEEIFNVLMAADVLWDHTTRINLDVRWLLGARMDRSIDNMQPSTLTVVADLIDSAWFCRVRLFDVHSPIALQRLRFSSNVLPVSQVKAVLEQLGDVMCVAPDEGASTRTASILEECGWKEPIVQCQKIRDSQTGKLSGFDISNPSLVWGRRCLIIDDICDGGGTFVGIAAKLREAGATHVYLYVSHGIFSKKLPLEGIDHIYTTDSYADWNRVAGFSTDQPFLSCIPLNMREL